MNTGCFKIRGSSSGIGSKHFREIQKATKLVCSSNEKYYNNGKFLQLINNNIEIV